MHQMSVLICQCSASIFIARISPTDVEQNGSITSLVNDMILEHFVVQSSWFLNSGRHVDYEWVLDSKGRSCRWKPFGHNAQNTQDKRVAHLGQCPDIGMEGARHQERSGFDRLNFSSLWR